MKRPEVDVGKTTVSGKSLGMCAVCNKASESAERKLKASII